MMSADGSVLPVDPQPPPPPPPPPPAADPNNQRNQIKQDYTGMFNAENGSSSTQQRWAGAGPPPSSSSASMSSQRPSMSMSSDQYPHHHHHRSSFAAPHALESGQHMMNKTAADLLSPAISNTHDALHLLSEAAGRTEDLNRQRMEYKYSNSAQNSSSTAAAAAAFNASGVSTAHGGPAGTTDNYNASRSDPTDGQQTASGATTMGGWYEPQKANRAAPVDPAVEAQESSNLAQAQAPRSSEQADYENAWRVWSRLRFIRAGWFSVDEAMAYIA